MIYQTAPELEQMHLIFTSPPPLPQVLMVLGKIPIVEGLYVFYSAFMPLFG